MALVQARYLEPNESLEFEKLITEMVDLFCDHLKKNAELNLVIRGWYGGHKTLAFFKGGDGAFRAFDVPESFDSMEVTLILVERLKQLFLPCGVCLSESLEEEPGGRWYKTISTST